MSGARWAVALTSPQMETTAARNATKDGFEVFLPKIASKTKAGANRVEALFPGYMFVVVKDAWHELLMTIGVRGIVSCSGKPSTLVDSEIDRVRAMCNRNGFLVPSLIPKFRRGQKVQINSGPFRYEAAEFETMLPNRRAAVLIEILGHKVRMRMSEGDLIAA